MEINKKQALHWLRRLRRHARRGRAICIVDQRAQRSTVPVELSLRVYLTHFRLAKKER